MKKDSDKIKAFEDCFPGRAVQLNGVEIRIRPLTIGNVRRFTDVVGKLLPLLEKPLSPGGAPEEDAVWGKKILPALLPLACNDLLGLVDDCVDVDLFSVPHWTLPVIVTAWIEESFGSPEKLRPWAELIESLRARFLTGT